MMTLYSTATCPFSHRCRIVLHEKDMDFQVVDVDPNNIPEDVATITSRGNIPILVERDLVLYEANIINEYIDDRFPHPQLMPAEPVARARARLFLHRFEKEFFCHIETLEQGSQKTVDKIRTEIANGLVMIAPILDKQKYILGDDYTMLDVAIAPLLWRLDHYGIKLPKQAAPLLKYAERLFSRPLFIDALTPAEKLMRK